MSNSEPSPRAPGLDRIEIALFVFGVLAMAILMLAFAQPLAGDTYLPIVGVWVVGGLGFIWWFHRHLAGSSKPPRTRARMSRLSAGGRRRHPHS